MHRWDFLDLTDCPPSPCQTGAAVCAEPGADLHCGSAPGQPVWCTVASQGDRVSARLPAGPYRAPFVGFNAVLSRFQGKLRQFQLLSYL